MGFLRQLFGTKKPPTPSSPAASPLPDSKPKKRWGFPRSRQDRTRHASSPYPEASADNLDASKHAIAVAAATAAVAEAALAAAHAAAEVVRLTNSGGGAGWRRGAAVAHAGGARRWAELVAAVKIQSAFRGYLARRALRALRALVRLQAVVRGHIVRKQTADMLRRMQTLVRVQARARSSRANISDPRSHDHPRCGSNLELRGTIDIDKARTDSNWLDQWMEENLCRDSDEKSEKILEVDTWKPRPNYQPTGHSSRHHWSPRHNNHWNGLGFDSPSKYLTKGHSPIPIPIPTTTTCVGQNSPQGYRPGSSGSPRSFTPARSDYSWSYYSGCSNHPNYMSNTESFRAKVRSQSAPRQRLEYGQNRRTSQGSWDGGSNSERDSVQCKNRGLTRNGSANFNLR